MAALAPGSEVVYPHHMTLRNACALFPKNTLFSVCRPRTGWLMPVVSFMLLLAVSGFGQDPLPFLEGLPAWMDQKPTASNPPPVWNQTPMRDPQEPIDPEPAAGGIKPPQGPRTGSRVQFQFDRPKMPDLSRIREKATRTTYQRTATGTDQALSESFSLEQVGQWESQAADLASRSTIVSDPIERENLLSRHRELTQRLDAVRELARLLGFATDTTRLASVSVNLEPLSPAQRQRFRELKEALGLARPSSFPASDLTFPARVSRQPALPSNLGQQPQMISLILTASPAAMAPASAASTPLAAPATPAKIPERFYRPGSIPLLGRNQDDQENSETNEETAEPTE